MQASPYDSLAPPRGGAPHLLKTTALIHIMYTLQERAFAENTIWTQVLTSGQTSASVGPASQSRVRKSFQILDIFPY